MLQLIAQCIIMAHSKKTIADAVVFGWPWVAFSRRPPPPTTPHHPPSGILEGGVRVGSRGRTQSMTRASLFWTPGSGGTCHDLNVILCWAGPAPGHRYLFFRFFFFNFQNYIHRFHLTATYPPAGSGLVINNTRSHRGCSLQTSSCHTTTTLLSHATPSRTPFEAPRHGDNILSICRVNIYNHYTTPNSSTVVLFSPTFVHGNNTEPRSNTERRPPLYHIATRLLQPAHPASTYTPWSANLAAEVPRILPLQ